LPSTETILPLSETKPGEPQEQISALVYRFMEARWRIKPARYRWCARLGLVLVGLVLDSLVCMPLFRLLLLLRRSWKLLLWTHLVWRIEKLNLNMIPIHPDGTAGLGNLEVTKPHLRPESALHPDKATRATPRHVFRK
jgi:hypothetical protein